MKNVFLLLAANSTSLACAIWAIIMAMHDKPGWGWLLFVAFFTTTVKFKSGGDMEIKKMV
jgi:hypothetical protein